MRKQGNITLTKEQIKTPEKRPKQNGDKQSTRCRVQNTGYKMLKELSEDLNSIKKIQSDTLIEIKNNLQEKPIEWMKLIIKSMIWNTRKKITNNQKKKKEPPKMRIV